ncbi:hypothetical protein [Streptomyces bacillaris]|uniref:hypothetical protein n=1 Tax=Streptomyces bacillaris TaxID=68179 RepID=UPI00345F7665
MTDAPASDPGHAPCEADGHGRQGGAIPAHVTRLTVQRADGLREALLLPTEKADMTRARVDSHEEFEASG